MKEAHSASGMLLFVEYTCRDDVKSLSQMYRTSSSIYFRSRTMAIGRSQQKKAEKQDRAARFPRVRSQG